MTSPLITVIIPVYNVKQYLKRCLDSVIEQTYKNLEIIIVNDGSTDTSEKICAAYKSKDERIILINKDNGGLSDARNAGLNIASGDYIFFIDSDDYVSCDIVRILCRDAKENNADIAVASFQNFDETTPKKLDGCNGKTKVLDTKEALESMLYQKDCTNSAWGKLYKRKLFNNIRYPKGKTCEDIPVTYRLFARAKKITMNSSKLYYYYQRSSSIINSPFTLDRFDALKFTSDETAFIREKYPEILKSAFCREFMESVYILRKIGKKNEEFSVAFLKAKTVLKSTRKEVLFDRKAKIKFRILALISYFSLPLMLKVIEAKKIKK